MKVDDRFQFWLKYKKKTTETSHEDPHVLLRLYRKYLLER
jgi:hypothetical protein